MKNESDVLGMYKGLPILSTKIVVNKLGDGLSKAVGIEPVVIEADDKAYLAVEVAKTKDRYDLVKDDEGKTIGYELVQVFDSQAAIFVDGKAVAKGIDKMRDKIKKDEDERKGRLSFDFTDPDEEHDETMSNRERIRAEHPELASKVDEALKDAS